MSEASVNVDPSNYVHDKTRAEVMANAEVPFRDKEAVAKKMSEILKTALEKGEHPYSITTDLAKKAGEEDRYLTIPEEDAIHEIRADYGYQEAPVEELRDHASLLDRKAERYSSEANKAGEEARHHVILTKN